MSGISPAPFGGGDFDNAWVLGVDFVLAAPGGRDIELGSPATNGRPGGSGYGGFFWRAPAGDVLPHVFAEAADGADVFNGSTEPWVALTTRRYGLVFTGLGSGDHWFVRAADYPGVCAALAYKRPRARPCRATTASWSSMAGSTGPRQASSRSKLRVIPEARLGGLA
jgi:hypothetical protein